MATTDYTRIIQEIIPSGHPDGTLQDGSKVTSRLSINEITRQITPGSDFNNLIGTTDDVNTNIITLEAPQKIEEHLIEACDHRVIKWHNLTSGERGANELKTTAEAEAEKVVMEWVVPPEAYTAAGTIKISFLFYDEDSEGKVTYRWSSLPYSGLNVGQGMDEVFVTGIPLAEIITVDLATRKITIPAGLNKEIGKIGEQNLNTLKFRCDRYFQGIDFWGAGITILHQIGDKVNPCSVSTKRLIPGTPTGEHNELESRSDLIEFELETSQILANMNKTGAVEISVYIMLEGDKLVIWKSDINSELRVGESMAFSLTEDEIQPGTGEIVLVNSENLDTKLDELLGSDGTEKSGAISTTDAIVYAIQRLMNTEFVFNAGDASEFITE